MNQRARTPTTSNWRTRRYGRISGGSLEQVLEMFDVAWAERTSWTPHEVGSEEWFAAVAKLVKVPSWIELYREPIEKLLARLVVQAGVAPGFVEAVRSENSTERLVEWAKGLPDDPPDDPALLPVTFALVGNLDAIGQYSRTIHDMFLAAERGDLQAMFQALSIDSHISSMPFFQSVLRLGQLSNDHAAADEIFRTLKGPHRKRNEYPKLRWVEYLLRDQDAFEACTREEIYELCVVHLRVYDPSGTKKDPKAALFARFRSWQKEAGIQNPRFGLSAKAK